MSVVSIQRVLESAPYAPDIIHGYRFPWRTAGFELPLDSAFFSAEGRFACLIKKSPEPLDSDILLDPAPRSEASERVSR
jgi:hypothetical protein